jgi:hypothetical protein
MNETSESKIANTILERHQIVMIGDMEYEVAQPSTATLIEVSELVSQLPSIKLDSENILQETLMIAKECRLLGKIAATLILGAVRLTNSQPSNLSRLKSLIQRQPKRRDVECEELGKVILSNMNPKELNSLIVKILSSMEISTFFSLTTTLLDVNLLRRTRAVV